MRIKRRVVRVIRIGRVMPGRRQRIRSIRRPLHRRRHRPRKKSCVLRMSGRVVVVWSHMRRRVGGIIHITRVIPRPFGLTADTRRQRTIRRCPRHQRTILLCHRHPRHPRHRPRRHPRRQRTTLLCRRRHHRPRPQRTIVHRTIRLRTIHRRTIHRRTIVRRTIRLKTIVRRTIHRKTIHRRTIVLRTTVR